MGIKHSTNVRSFASTTTTTTTTTTTFSKIGVVGLGLMGHGIAQVVAQAFTHNTSSSSSLPMVVAYETQEKYLISGKERIEKSMERMVQKNKITLDDAKETLNRIHYTTNIQELHNMDLIVEAVIENMDLKRQLYTQLGTICQPNTILASNTSSLSITEMAHYSGRTDRFVGIHFFNPVQMMPLVEIISTLETDPIVLQQVHQFVLDLDKTPVQCGDTPGFIVNRLLVPFLMQAMILYEQKCATIVDIDTAMKLGAGHPMGPLHLADYIGLDTCLYIVQGWTTKYPTETAFVIPTLLQQLVQEGNMGRKSGRGFYYWDGDKRGEPAM